MKKLWQLTDCRAVPVHPPIESPSRAFYENVSAIYCQVLNHSFDPAGRFGDLLVAAHRRAHALRVCELKGQGDLPKEGRCQRQSPL